MWCGDSALDPLSVLKPSTTAAPQRKDRRWDAFMPSRISRRFSGGRGGIRTHGGLPHARFRVECLKPDSATLPFLQDRHPADRFRKERVYYEASTIICKSAPSIGIITPTGRS